MNGTLIVPNIRYASTILNDSIIDSVAIKTFKIFIVIVTGTVLLNADPSCDGIEIVIYNNSESSIVRDSESIITRLCRGQSAKLIYLVLINKWING